MPNLVLLCFLFFPLFFFIVFLPLVLRLPYFFLINKRNRSCRCIPSWQFLVELRIISFDSSEPSADGLRQFELIQRLEGHHGEVWALAVSNQGNFVVTGSHDKSIRIWEKTDEPLFLEEERERELEAMYDSNLADNLNSENRLPGDDGDVDGAEVEAVQKQTAETLMAGERIMEAIELADAEREVVRQWQEDKSKLPPAQAEALQRPPKNPELLARGDIEPADHVLFTIQKVPAAGMEDALLVLPFRMVVSLLEYLDEWAKAVSDA
jgi:U3 small nucleolar RNA-associated protein 12